MRERIGPHRLARLSALTGFAHHTAPRERRRKIVQRQNRNDAGERARRGRIDAANGGMGMLAAHKRHMEQPGKRDVVDEAARAR